MQQSQEQVFHLLHFVSKVAEWKIRGLVHRQQTEYKDTE